MDIAFYASERQYAEHLIEIYKFLARMSPKGTFYGSARVVAWLKARHGIDALSSMPPQNCYVVVAAFSDLEFMRPRLCALVNHGSGQTYWGDPKTYRHPSYSGGMNRERVTLYVCPNEMDAARNLYFYPGAEAIVAGLPKVIPNNKDGRDAIAFSFHWDGHLIPEMRWAFPHFGSAVKAISKQYKVIGHGHPRVWLFLKDWYEEVGIEPVANFDDVCRRALLYCADNTSTLYEFTLTGRPVLVMNAPWYRKNVHHGLRFWNLVPGVQIDDPSWLQKGVDLALSDPQLIKEARQRISKMIYPYSGQQSVEIAAKAIEAHVRKISGLGPYPSRSDTCQPTQSYTT